MKKLFGYDVDDILGVAGLERKNTFLGTFLPALGLLFAGAAIGAGVGLAFAPSSGRRLRQDVGEKLDQIRDRAKAETQKQQGAYNATPPHQA